ncbi:MAG: acetylornithine aminotransferase [Spirochaetes bacterium]|nr:MAG: acetylornithine aminotransferase [Spirochaetota bacterium]
MKTNGRASVVTDAPFPKNYSQELLLVSRGKGVYVEDSSGERYLDFGSGIAVNALGYGREDLAEVAFNQMKKLIHISNLYTTAPAVELAERLISFGSFSAVHFGNSGSEANEAAIKYARLYSLRKRGEGCHRILCFEGAFHGRTMGALSCTPNPAYQKPFAPLLPGVETIEYNNVEKLEETLNGSFSCVIAEVIQGEGGLEVMTKEFAEALNRECKKHDVILIVDEIQTGLGRIGYRLASDWVGLEPDIVTLSKPLAGGLPLSATLIPAKVNNLLQVGEHGSTFGGGPVTTSVANRVLDIILDPVFLDQVRSKASVLHDELTRISEELDFIGAAKGAGMLKGLEVKAPKEKESEVIKKLIEAARDEGILIIKSGRNVLRIAPPLIITEEEIREGVDILRRALSGFQGNIS